MEIEIQVLSACKFAGLDVVKELSVINASTPPGGDTNSAPGEVGLAMAVDGDGDQIQSKSAYSITTPPLLRRWLVINLDLIASSFHIKQAVFKSLLSEQKGRLKTKCISAEVLYNCSSSRKINDAILHYGINSISSPEGTETKEDSTLDPLQQLPRDVAIVFIPPLSSSPSSSSSSTSTSTSTSSTTSSPSLSPDHEETLQSIISKYFIECTRQPLATLDAPEWLDASRKERIFREFKFSPEELKVSNFMDCITTRIAVKDIL